MIRSVPDGQSTPSQTYSLEAIPRQKTPGAGPPPPAMPPSPGQFPYDAAGKNVAASRSPGRGVALASSACTALTQSIKDISAKAPRAADTVSRLRKAADTVAGSSGSVRKWPQRLCGLPDGQGHRAMNENDGGGARPQGCQPSPCPGPGLEPGREAAGCSTGTGVRARAPVQGAHRRLGPLCLPALPSLLPVPTAQTPGSRP